MRLAAKIQEACSYDKDCVTDLTFCKDQKTCMCKPGYEPLASKNGCQATEGAQCDTDSDCSGLGNLANSECKQNLCKCRDTFVPSSNKSLCLAIPMTIQEPCEETLQCTESFGYTSFCDQSQHVCSCTANNHFANGKCVVSVNIDSLRHHRWETPNSQPKLPQRTRQLDLEDQHDPYFYHLSQSTTLRGACEENIQCLLYDANNQTMLECVNSVCACKEGYKEENNSCVHRPLARSAAGRNDVTHLAVLRTVRSKKLFLTWGLTHLARAVGFNPCSEQAEVHQGRCVAMALFYTKV
uniref:EB domain-containing protein n=1 Tax=Timema bartmani TaxID=61472 RepID=A0A7R9I6M6_9NEOP|nr:unnamed protein product [Timema bartmani]